MIRSRPRATIVCIRCDDALTSEERDHYGWQCHLCALREHDLERALARDPDHPERDWLEAGPVHLGPPRPVGRARAA